MGGGTGLEGQVFIVEGGASLEGQGVHPATAMLLLLILVHCTVSRSHDDHTHVYNPIGPNVLAQVVNSLCVFSRSGYVGVGVVNKG